MVFGRGGSPPARRFCGRLTRGREATRAQRGLVRQGVQEIRQPMCEKC